MRLGMQEENQVVQSLMESDAKRSSYGATKVAQLVSDCKLGTLYLSLTESLVSQHCPFAHCEDLLVSLRNRFECCTVSLSVLVNLRSNEMLLEALQALHLDFSDNTGVSTSENTSARCA